MALLAGTVTQELVEVVLAWPRLAEEVKATLPGIIHRAKASRKGRTGR